jgi:hydrogenase maturation protein HypF
MPEGVHIEVRGAVQGVGFRPFVYRLAHELGLTGWVNNSAQGVVIEVCGPEMHLHTFLARLADEKPPAALIQEILSRPILSNGYTTFEIIHSDSSGPVTTLVSPDLALCADCLRELLDPADRRYLYPFINCTNCGPRYSIIEALPYDRPNTSMRLFPMCPACAAEYHDPGNRRFHAQPNACPVCGPHVELWDTNGQTQAAHHDAILAAVEAIRAGQIVALKGLGGFHLLVDARNVAAVERLRQRKHRPTKPLALMYPSLARLEQDCQVSRLEASLLTSPAAPIVLLRRRQDHALSDRIAPANPYLGVMLPYTPLHHILIKQLGFPLVATSGNLSDEPICIDENDALQRLQGIADCFLVHNRPIVRHVDDSIVQVVAGELQMVRRARGYAPLPLPVSGVPDGTLAVGAHLKNAVALAAGSSVFISQHIGDLETAAALEACQQTVASFEKLYHQAPRLVVHDTHPDYGSTQYAQRLSLPSIAVQHHHAHVLACAADNGLTLPVLGVAWDGTGLGADHTVWGGEFLYTTETGYERAAYLRPFCLPGGEQAVKEPRRAALGLLYEIFGDTLFDHVEASISDWGFSSSALRTLIVMMQRGLNAPRTSSAGRLFDGAAALLNICQQATYEGEAAAALEYQIGAVATDAVYPFELRADVLDWEPMIRHILADMAEGVSSHVISAQFHNTLVEMIAAVAQRVGEPQVALTGGCFQNRYLQERAIARLRMMGFKPYWHHQVPPNDGGIALGQMVVAKAQEKG